jgi:hypothetical protein
MCNCNGGGSAPPLFGTGGTVPTGTPLVRVVEPISLAQSTVAPSTVSVTSRVFPWWILIVILLAYAAHKRG